MNNKYESTSREIRKIIIEKAFECGQSTHLGGALSMVDLLAVLFEDVLRFNAEEPEWEDRDIFILSKGHTVLGYFATLFHYGYLSDEVFSTFQTNGSKFIAHPIKNLKYGVESSNGSLGQGISYASGMALGYRKKSMSNRVYAMLGDGECNEGSVWEAAHLAAVEQLDNLVAIIDHNGFRNDGPTSYQPRQLCEMWRSFGWNSIEVDGHDVIAIEKAFKTAQDTTNKPTAIIAQTIKGKGIEMMESNNDWHHNRITKSIYEQCIAQLEG